MLCFFPCFFRVFWLPCYLFHLFLCRMAVVSPGYTFPGFSMKRSWMIDLFSLLWRCFPLLIIGVSFVFGCRLIKPDTKDFLVICFLIPCYFSPTFVVIILFWTFYWFGLSSSCFYLLLAVTIIVCYFSSKWHKFSCCAWLIRFTRTRKMTKWTFAGYF